jgi:hypothetical protein
MGPPILRFLAVFAAVVGVTLAIIFTVLYARDTHDLQVRLKLGRFTHIGDLNVALKPNFVHYSLSCLPTAISRLLSSQLHSAIVCIPICTTRAPYSNDQRLSFRCCHHGP